MSIIQEAVNFAMKEWEKKPPKEVIELTKRALIDYVAVTLSGSREPISQIMQKYVQTQSTKTESKVFGADFHTTGNLATLVNGVAAHAQDYDDISDTTMGHPTVTVAPSAFSVGESSRSSGLDIIKAYVIGIEVMHKIARLYMPVVSEKGWHTTSVFGPFGAATTSALLEELDQKSFCSALGIAASKASGLRSNFGTLTKPYHAGMAAYNGTTAAILGKLGINSSENALEAVDGFSDIFADGNVVNSSLEFGDPWDIVNPGIQFKKYPCCSGSHTAIDCILEMMKSENITDQNIKSIEAGVSLLGPRELICHNPKNSNEARFSIEYVLAAAVVYKKVGVEQFKDYCIKDSSVQKIIKKVQMTVDEEYAKFGFISDSPVKLKITLDDGRIIKGEKYFAEGHPKRPLNDKDLSEKFFDCSNQVLDNQTSQTVLNTLFALEELDDVSKLVKML